MKKTIITALAIIAAATIAQAVVTVRTVGDGNWTDPANWNTAYYPGGPGGGLSDDLARIHNENTITIDSAVPVIGKVQLGFNGAGTLNINSGGSLSVTDADLGNRDAATLLVDGGTINASGTFKVGNGGASYLATPGQVTVNNGGSVTIGSNFFVGANFNNGTFTLNDGTVSALNLTLGDSVNVTTAAVNLLGGSLTLTSGTLNIASFGSGSALLNIENDAQMILGGNKLGLIGGYVTSLNIAWANGTGIAGVGDQTWDNGSGSYLHAAFDGTDTTVWANQTVPEPSTFGLLLGFAALGFLTFHRRSRRGY